MHCSDQQIHLIRFFSLFNAKTGYCRLDTAKTLDNSLWSLSRSRSPKPWNLSERSWSIFSRSRSGVGVKNFRLRTPLDERWHGPLMVRILGGPLSLNERAAHNIFSGWILPNRYEPPANVEKTFKIFLSWKKHSVAIKASETTWHLLGIFFRCGIFGQIFFPIWEHSVSATGWYTF